MRFNGLLIDGVEVGADPTPKMGKAREGDKWVETGVQSTRADGLLGWQIKILVQTGDDERERVGTIVTVWAPVSPKIADRDLVRFPDLDVRAYGEDRFGLTASAVQVAREGKWVAA